MLKTKKSKMPNNIAFFKKTSFLSIIIFLLFPVTNTILFYYYSDRAKPQTYVGTFNVSNLSKQQAEKTISQANLLQNKTIDLLFGKEIFSISMSDVNLSYDTKSTIEEIFQKKNNVILNLFSVKNIYFNKGPFVYPFYFHINEEKLDSILSVINERVTTEAVFPKAKIVNENISIENGINGITINAKELKTEVVQHIKYANINPFIIPTTIIVAKVDENKIAQFVSGAQNIINKNIQFMHEDNIISADENQLLSFLNIPEGFDDTNINSFISFVEKEINREPQNSVFIFNNNKVEEFTPSKKGVEVLPIELKEKITDCLNSIIIAKSECNEIQIPVVYTDPAITNNQVNNLGINERIGVGNSLFKGSISSRVHNIGLAASKINGTLLAPNEEFSFNKTLGDVSALTGYKQAYIIKDGKTVLGDGGGVCQVSTTLFRALLNSGLPITERAAHSYRVYYYEQESSPGIDATVYDPSPDLKFVNNTSAHILLQTSFEPKSYRLSIEIYGTSDGRISHITKPVMSNVTPPAEDLYVDDPSLPVGTIKQTEHKSWGAKVVFDYRVEKNGEIIFQKQFVSNYKPWQAVYLKGTAPI